MPDIEVEAASESKSVETSLPPVGERSFKLLYEKGMKAVESSTIAAIGYFDTQAQDVTDKGMDGCDLVIQFKNGGAYIVEGVLEKTFRAILTADSPGKAYDMLVKKDAALKSLVKKLGD